LKKPCMLSGVMEVDFPCTRCGGHGIVYKRVENDRGIPHDPWHGICYRCQGAMIDPYYLRMIPREKGWVIHEVYKYRGERVASYSLWKLLQLLNYNGLVSNEYMENIVEDEALVMVQRFTNYRVLFKKLYDYYMVVLLIRKE
jgi:RecJ-like exonuclease